MAEKDEAAIRARAYQLWAQGGYVDGEHDHHWRQAERELGGADLPLANPGPPAPPERRVDGISPLPAMEGSDAPPRRGDGGGR